VPRRRESTILCLIQCGETTWEAERRVHGATDLPLSESGRSSIKAAAAHTVDLGAGPVLHPPDEAATETAGIFADAHGLKTRGVPELSDPNLGLLEGLTGQVFAERFPRRYKQWQDDPMSLSPPEGEDLTDARVRIFAAVSRILRRGKSDELTIVLHALGLGLLRCWLADRPSRDVWAVLKDRPAVERYAITTPMIQWLDDAATATVSSRS
jgi:broad specificity phosphatase PhoE